MANLNDNVSAAFKKAQQQAVYAGGHMEGVAISMDSANNKLYKLELGTGKKIKLVDKRVLYIVGAGE